MRCADMREWPASMSLAATTHANDARGYARGYAMNECLLRKTAAQTKSYAVKISVATCTLVIDRAKARQ